MSSIGSDNALVRVRLKGIAHARTAWAEGFDVSVPRSALDAGLRSSVNTRGELTLPADPPPLDPGVAAQLRLRALFTPVAPSSSRLPFSYRAVPGPIRRLIAGAMGRAQRRRVDEWAQFPGWPIDVSADVLQDWVTPNGEAGGCGTPTPVILTHDIDSPEGLRNLVGDFLPLEESHRARSTNYVVPCGWPLDDGLLREAHSRGHELGIHGYDHANRTAFADAGERRRRLDAGRQLADRFGMTGYRAPSLLRTRALLEDLAPRYRYDSSVPTSGGLFPVPNNGCASTRPFRIGAIVEIPISLPRDGSLRFLGYTPDQIVETWTTCADIVARARGVVVLLTHCEHHFSGNAQMLRAYRNFLDWVSANPRFAWSTPAEILARV
jgi:peptidoglycan/xylan/chitin deacetylase (PgdA/CDA1 family)